MGLADLVRRERANAIFGWIVAVVVTVTAAANFISNAAIWGGFSLVFFAVIALPAVATRDRWAMAPWPLLSIAAIAVTSRVAGLFPEAAGYVAIATLALVIVVELEVFTSIQLSRRFAVIFAVLTSLAIEAVWIIIQFFSDLWLGTDFLSTQTALQKDIVIVTIVSFALGVIFYWYLMRVAPVRLVEEPSRLEEAT